MAHHLSDRRVRARRAILAAVREMAREFPSAEYCRARAEFGLLGRVKDHCERAYPTAKQCWEAVGLERSHLVDEFRFAQEDIARDTPAAD